MERRTKTSMSDILDRQGWTIALAAFIFGIVVAILVIVSVDLARDDDDCHLCVDSNVSSDCDDGNECTIDVLNGGFGCTNYNAPSTTSCTSTANCYYDATNCYNGECVGTNCTGSCVVVGDCPDIEFNGTGAFGAGACTGHACIYTILQNVTYGKCGVLGTIYKEQCQGYLALNGTYTACLEIDQTCINDYLERFSTLVCTYRFACATSHANPSGIPASGKKRSVSDYPYQYFAGAA